MTLVAAEAKRNHAAKVGLGTVRFYAASAVSSSGASSSTCESQYSTPTIWCGCRQCGQKTFAESNWLSVARSISMPVETSSPLAGQMKTSVPIFVLHDTPPRQDQNRTGLPMQDGSGAMHNKAGQKRRSPGERPGPLTAKWRDYDIRLFERLRHHRLLVMPEAPSKSDRRHRDDDGQSEKCPHC